MAKKKKKSKKKSAAPPKFADAPQRAGLLTRQCASCAKYHHPRSAACPNCGAKAKKKDVKKKDVKKKPGAAQAKKTAMAASDPMQAAIKFVTACGGLDTARGVLDMVATIRKL